MGPFGPPSFMSIMIKVLTIVRTQISLCRGLHFFCFTYFAYFPEFETKRKIYGKIKSPLCDLLYVDLDCIYQRKLNMFLNMFYKGEVT